MLAVSRAKKLRVPRLRRVTANMILKPRNAAQMVILKKIQKDVTDSVRITLAIAHPIVLFRYCLPMPNFQVV
ncbi:MAG: hypothetical protein Q8M62_13490 [Algoriphagus sp.]|uniref:hypothetical protein n=1 Tax=Algoriphagus sp. TaxID=1872435 RepID=UPI001ECA8CD7|nr:hypothetical protein [Algoriphagus sp.]MBA4301339.1 hypothetical protein [Cyclobacterium sp.]MDP3200839.1 hypothetical protein [Algoriphagus sp.]